MCSCVAAMNFKAPADRQGFSRQHRPSRDFQQAALSRMRCCWISLIRLVNPAKSRLAQSSSWWWRWDASMMPVSLVRWAGVRGSPKILDGPLVLARA